MPEDTKFSDIWGLNNPVMVGSGGNPKDIATFVEACFTGNTLWPSGAAMVIDNDITFSLHQLHRRLRRKDSYLRGEHGYGTVQIYLCRVMTPLALQDEEPVAQAEGDAIHTIKLVDGTAAPSPLLTHLP